MVKLVYFAWVRERIGKSQEDIELPEHVGTIEDLITHLKSLDEGYEIAFQEPDIIRVALNKVHSDHHAPIKDAHEIAFFPPMTGG